MTTIEKKFFKVTGPKISDSLHIDASLMTAADVPGYVFGYYDEKAGRCVAVYQGNMARWVPDYLPGIRCFVDDLGATHDHYFALVMSYASRIQGEF